MRRISRSGISTTAGFGLGAFSIDELDTIHYSTLQILQDTGIKVMNEEALEIFHGGGASIERLEGYGIVKLPSYLVEQCTFLAPRTIVYDARSPNDDFMAEPNRVGFTTFGGCINVIDPFHHAYFIQMITYPGDFTAVFLSCRTKFACRRIPSGYRITSSFSSSMYLCRFSSIVLKISFCIGFSL